jgi:F-type H+-transporting ATPase subunit b
MNLGTLHNLVLAAAASGGAAKKKSSDSGTFLVSPALGLMLWTLLAFGVTMYVLSKLAFPRIADALDKRQHAIEDSIDHAASVRKEADELLAEYRERLKEARQQADDIVSRARKAGEAHSAEVHAEAKETREELMEQTRRDIELETQRAIQEIRKEVADLTILATEKVTRKTLDEDDQKRLVEEALSELDFSTLSAER